MIYANKEMKIDALVGYINANKINLIPAFQRGQVWTPTLRKKLVTNMIMGRPIPAIFLYKEESGSMFAYNILDGKQRLESLILFIGDKHKDMRIAKVNDFFFAKPLRNLKNFKIDLEGEIKGFANLDQKTVREFREYAIPTIEISLEDSSVAEIVQLFVDINTYGVKVSRFDVVKAMALDPLLGSVLDFIAVKQKRGQTIHYRAKATATSRVLGRVSIISRHIGNARVDRMWERLTEIALFARTSQHRAPVAILKAFIKGGEKQETLTKEETKRVRHLFEFLYRAYKASKDLAESRLATDQPSFYTMVTTLLTEDLLGQFGEDSLTKKLTKFGRIIGLKEIPPKAIEAEIVTYQDRAAKQTTNSGRRDERQKAFVIALKAL